MAYIELGRRSNSCGSCLPQALTSVCQVLFSVTNAEKVLCQVYRATSHRVGHKNLNSISTRLNLPYTNAIKQRLPMQVSLGLLLGFCR